MEQKAGVLSALTLVPSVRFERTGGRPNFHDHSASIDLVSAVYRALGIKWRASQKQSWLWSLQFEGTGKHPDKDSTLQERV